MKFRPGRSSAGTFRSSAPSAIARSAVALAAFAACALGTLSCRKTGEQDRGPGIASAVTDADPGRPYWALAVFADTCATAPAVAVPPTR